MTPVQPDCGWTILDKGERGSKTDKAVYKYNHIGTNTNTKQGKYKYKHREKYKLIQNDTGPA